MSASTIPGSDYQVIAPTEHAGLTCRFLKPADFTLADLPPATPDFSDGAQFMPLAVAMTPYGPMVFTVAARPAFDDGTVAQWLDYICQKESYPHTPVTATSIGACPAVTCDATQTADDGTKMKMRFVLFEDGGRLLQMSAMAPEAFWSAAMEKMAPMLASFELRETRGTKVALFADMPAPAAKPAAKTAAAKSPAKPTKKAAPAPEPKSETKPEPKPEPTAFMTPAELAAMALADDASSLDEENPMNARLRNNGAGLVPRVASVDLAGKSARVGAGAVQGFFRVPLGWHVIDDGKRTLVFDAGGRIQVNLSQRLHEGAATKDFARQLLQQYLDEQPGLLTIEHTLSGIAAAGVRGVTVGKETLDQYFLVRDIGRERLYLVARVSSNAEDAMRALNLAGDILATFDAPAAGT